MYFKAVEFIETICPDNEKGTIKVWDGEGEGAGNIETISSVNIETSSQAIKTLKSDSATLLHLN